MKKIAASATAASLILATAGVLTGLPAHAAPGTADDHRQSTHTLRLVVTPGVDTDIDLGASGPSAGDQQVFHDKLMQNGKQIGSTAGVAEIVTWNDTGFTANVVSTATLANGTFTTQESFDEVFADGPPADIHAAITGGTGAYRSARGECVDRFVENSDDTSVNCTIQLSP